ncbi:MAG: hypothetical protein Q7K54_01585 [Candidatus Parcubacteria bacterium]|nr:hypothetical protein [Candidatus Parcubacteria bacterium]
MIKFKLSYIVFLFIVGLLVISAILFLFNPGFVVQLIGIFSLYYVIPIALLLLLIDFVFNSQHDKKYLFYAVVSIIVLLGSSFVLRYLVSNSFHIFP